MESSANRLPFDVLCIIFEQYMEADGHSWPKEQETLLLVSRSWYKAALDHAVLWAKLYIHLTSWDEVGDWTSCVVRRLRYSANALLDIRVTTGIYDSSNQKGKASRKATERLLLTLVGESGALARRWRRFVVGDAFSAISSTTLAFCLSFPAPNLQEFGAVYLDCDREILPDASSLKLFSIIGCTLPKYPNLKTVTDLDISFCKRKLVREHGIDEHAVGLARNLRSLRIDMTDRYKLCGTYPHLKNLKLRGAIYEDCLTEFYAPNLSDLSLILISERDYLSVVFCPGIHLDNVKTARIGMEDVSIGRFSSCLSGIRPLLTQLVNLETLILDDSHMVHFAFKLLTGECEHLYQSHTLRIVLDDYSGELGRGEARRANVDALRQWTGCFEGDYVCQLLSA